MFFALVGIFILLLWLFLSWRPLVPKIDATLARFGQMIGICFKSVSCLGGGSDLREARNDIGQNFAALTESLRKLYHDLGMSDSGDLLKIFKILTSYFQVSCVSLFSISVFSSCVLTRFSTFPGDELLHDLSC
jgi:hypothetical protein